MTLPYSWISSRTARTITSGIALRGALTTWQSLFAEAADFATGLGPKRLISISHSEDQNDGVVTVWYWDEIEGGDEYA